MADTAREGERKRSAPRSRPRFLLPLTMRGLVEGDDLNLLDNDSRLDIGEASLHHGRDVEFFERLLVERALQLLEGEGEVEDAASEQRREVSFLKRPLVIEKGRKDSRRVNVHLRASSRRWRSRSSCLGRR